MRIPSPFVALLLLLTPAIAGSFSSLLAAEDMAIYQVGLARADITPQSGIRLNGFGFRTASLISGSSHSCHAALGSITGMRS
jgi:hypothetical protein